MSDDKLMDRYNWDSPFSVTNPLSSHYDADKAATYAGGHILLYGFIFLVCAVEWFKVKHAPFVAGVSAFWDAICLPYVVLGTAFCVYQGWVKKTQYSESYRAVVWLLLLFVGALLLLFCFVALCIYFFA